MSTIAVNTITDASGGSTASINGYTPTASNMAGRNRIINGDMRIDQRGLGTQTVNSSGLYTVDRWQANQTAAGKFSVGKSTTAPAGFTNSYLATSLSAYSVSSSDIFFFKQNIEGNNVADFAWGTASAKAVTLSFWVRSSLTGTFGGSLANSAHDRSYPFSYTISTADTWEQKSVTVAGDTTGTWLTDNGVGIQVIFGLGGGSTRGGTAGSWQASALYTATGATSVVGTSGATFYITGVQLEAGSVATPFEHRQYGAELQLCMRYFEKSYNVDVAPGTSAAVGVRTCSSSVGSSTDRYFGEMGFKATKRAVPDVTFYTQLGVSGALSKYSSSSTTRTISSTAGSSAGGIASYIQTTTGDSSEPYVFHFTADAEL